MLFVNGITVLKNAKEGVLSRAQGPSDICLCGELPSRPVDVLWRYIPVGLLHLHAYNI